MISPKLTTRCAIDSSAGPEGPAYDGFAYSAGPEGPAYDGFAYSAGPEGPAYDGFAYSAGPKGPAYDGLACSAGRSGLRRSGGRHARDDAARVADDHVQMSRVDRLRV